MWSIHTAFSTTYVVWNAREYMLVGGGIYLISDYVIAINSHAGTHRLYAGAWFYHFTPGESV